MKKIITLLAALTLSLNLCGSSFTLASGSLGAIPSDATVTNITSFNTGSGVTTLLTIPSGYRGAVQSAIIVNNATGADTISWYLNTNSVNYRFTSSFSLATNTTSGNSFASTSPIFEENESLIISNSISGTSAYVTVAIYPNSEGPFSSKLFSLSSGNNTLYTAPANYQAKILGPGFALQVAGGAIYVNDTAATRTRVLYLVANGGSPAESGRLSPILGTAAAGSVGLSFGSIPTVLYDVQSLVVTSDSSASGQWAWVSVQESQ